MNGVKDDRDRNASGGNPCLEQTLESYEMCCLVETFPYNHDSLEDFLETLKFAYMYAKTVTLGQTQWPRTNEVMQRNRRIGCSMSGIAQFISNRGLNNFFILVEHEGEGTVKCRRQNPEPAAARKRGRTAVIGAGFNTACYGCYSKPQASCRLGPPA